MALSRSQQSATSEQKMRRAINEQRVRAETLEHQLAEMGRANDQLAEENRLVGDRAQRQQLVNAELTQETIVLNEERLLFRDEIRASQEREEESTLRAQEAERQK